MRAQFSCDYRSLVYFTVLNFVVQLTFFRPHNVRTSIIFTIVASLAWLSVDVVKWFVRLVRS